MDFPWNVLFAPYLAVAWIVMWYFCKKIVIASELVGDRRNNATNMILGTIVLFGPIVFPFMPLLVIGYWIGHTIGDSADKDVPASDSSDGDDRS